MRLVHAYSAQRMRIRLSRSGEARALTHRQQIDLLRAALRRLPWPLATAGAKGKALRVAFGPAVSVGYESQAEYMDVDLTAARDPGALERELTAVLPRGYACLSVKKIPPRFPSLEQTLNVGEYKVAGLPLAPADMEAKAAAFQSRPACVIAKKKGDRVEMIDAKPLVREMVFDGDRARLLMRFGPGKNLKPERVLQHILELTEEQMNLLSVTRLALYAELPGGRLALP